MSTNNTDVDKAAIVANQYMSDLGLETQVICGIIVGLVLLIGLVLTLRGQKYFRFIMFAVSFIVAGLIPAVIDFSEMSKFTFSAKLRFHSNNFHSNNLKN